jgi:hypothetical protein
MLRSPIQIQRAGQQKRKNALMILQDAMFLFDKDDLALSISNISSARYNLAISMRSKADAEFAEDVPKNTRKKIKAGRKKTSTKQTAPVTPAQPIKRVNNKVKAATTNRMKGKLGH